MPAKLFISYSSRDQPIASRLAQDLRAVGLDVFVDFDAATGLGLGDSWRNKMRDQLESADAVLVLMSHAALASPEIQAEWRLLESKRVLPILVEPVPSEDIPPWLQERQWVDLSRDYDQGLSIIIRALNELQTSREPAVADAVDIERLIHDLIENRLRELGVTGAQKTESPVDTRYVVDDQLVFVVSSFRSDMEPAFEAIKSAAEKVGLRAERVKDVGGDYRITEKMIEMIHRAYLVVADLTHERPNVYFELGYARGIGKRVVIILREGTEVHFDVYDWQHLSYIDSRPLEKNLIDRFQYELGVDGRGAVGSQIAEN